MASGDWSGPDGLVVTVAVVVAVVTATVSVPLLAVRAWSIIWVLAVTGLTVDVVERVMMVL